MSSFKKKNRILICGLASFVLLCASISKADTSDFKIPQQFKPGDVISADVMNEVMEYIQAAKSSLQMSELIGSWQCKKYHTVIAEDTLFGYYATYADVDPDKLWKSADVNLVFSDDGDGTYSWGSSAYNAFDFGVNDFVASGDLC